jgi:hypothetical protein
LPRSAILVLTKKEKMKNFYLIVIIVFLYDTAWGQSSSKNAETDFEKLSWLEGTWTRTNAKPGRSGVEEWKRVGDNELVGLGIALKGHDTTFVEKIRLVIKDNQIFYAADVPENKSVVYFKITELTANSFVCENPDHDFPKKIAYTREGKKLTAIISGDGKSIPYTFERK